MASPTFVSFRSHRSPITSFLILSLAVMNMTDAVATNAEVLEQRGLSGSDTNSNSSPPPDDVAGCDLTCQNGGTCELLTFSRHHHHTIPKRCMCTPGYGGLECEIETSVCFTAFDKDWYCQAGAPCLLSRDGQHDYCDCRQSFDLSAFGGLECDFSATEYCTDDSNLSRVAFCTNGGACKTYVQDDDKEGHPGCNCPDGFEGNHCEYLEGHVREIDNTRTANQPQGNGYKIFYGFLIAIFTISVLLLLDIIRRWHKRRHPNGRVGDSAANFIMS